MVLSGGRWGRCRGSFPTVLVWLKTLGTSADKLHHTRSVAYLVVLVLLNKHQISYLHYYHTLFHPWVNFADSAAAGQDYSIGTAQKMSVDIDVIPDLLLLIQQKLHIV